MSKKDAVKDIQDVYFVGSFDRESSCPKDMIPEYAFIGRSNVGKSSLINMLCRRKEIAKVSKMPGKTQLINFFRVEDSWHIVDLPGYGYAQISKKKRQKWENMIERYLMMRKQLQCAMVLIDARHSLQKIDLEFINWLGSRHIPFVIIYTKIDKLKKLQRKNNIKKLQSDLLEHWHSLPQQFISSAETGEGRQEIINFIENLNNNF